MNVCDKTAENGIDVDEVYTGVHGNDKSTRVNAGKYISRRRNNNVRNISATMSNASRKSDTSSPCYSTRGFSHLGRRSPLLIPTRWTTWKRWFENISHDEAHDGFLEQPLLLLVSFTVIKESNDIIKLLWTTLFTEVQNYKIFGRCFNKS